MDDAYAAFIDEVQAGGFGAPTDGGWSAELIAAHVACNHEALIATTEAVLAQDPTSYDNQEQTHADLLAAYARSYGGLRGLADRIAVTAITLRELGALLEERGLGLVEVPVRLGDGGETVVDQPMPWAKLLEIDATVHVPRHLAQLRALRPS
jgi:hypothetical protein